MPIPAPLPPMSPLKKTLIAAVLITIFFFTYAMHLVATFPYPEFAVLGNPCSMSVTVISSSQSVASPQSQPRIKAVTSSGETIELTGNSQPAAGTQITVWRTTQADGHYTYEWLEDIPPLRAP